MRTQIRPHLLAIVGLLSMLAALLSSCAEPLDSTKSDDDTTALLTGTQAVYEGSSSEVCLDEDFETGDALSAMPRPLWRDLEGEHYAGGTVEPRDPNAFVFNLIGEEPIGEFDTTAVPARAVPDYRNLSHNLTILDSLRFLLTVINNLTSRVDDAREVVQGGLVNFGTSLIPQVTGHCVCIANGACAPDQALDRARALVEQFAGGQFFTDLLQDFATEQIDGVLGDLAEFEDFLRGRMQYWEQMFTTPAAANRPWYDSQMGIALEAAIRLTLTATINQLDTGLAEPGITACRELAEDLAAVGSTTTESIDQLHEAVDVTLHYLETDHFADQLAAFHAVVDTTTGLIAAFPAIRDDLRALADQFRDVERLEDLLAVDWGEVADLLEQIVTTVNDALPDDVFNDLVNGISALAADLANPALTVRVAASSALAVFETELSGTNVGICLETLTNDAYFAPGSGLSASTFFDAMVAGLEGVVLGEVQAIVDEADELRASVEDRILNIGPAFTAQLEEAVDDITDSLLEGCYMRGFRTECFDYCGAVDQDDFWWSPTDFVDQPQAAAAGVASAALFTLEYAGVLDEMVDWIEDELEPYLDGALGGVAEVLGDVAEVITRILNILSDAFRVLDHFSEGYHIGAYDQLRPDLHMCVAYAGHGAFASMLNLADGDIRIGARYTAHNLSVDHRAQFRSGGFAVSAFGHDLSLLPGIEANIMLDGFKLWDINRPFGIPLNVPIDASAVDRLDVFDVVDESLLPPSVGGFLVRDLYPARDSSGTALWPRGDLYNTVDRTGPVWEGSSTAVTSLGLNLGFELDPPRFELPPIVIVPGVLDVVPYFDFAAGLRWTHRTSWLRDRLLDRINENLGAADALSLDDFYRDGQPMQAPDVSQDNGTNLYVMPSLGAVLSLGFKLWVLRFEAYASIGLSVSIEVGGSGGLLDTNAYLVDQLTRSNPDPSAPCSPILVTAHQASCNNVARGGDPAATYACEPSQASGACCIRIAAEVQADGSTLLDWVQGGLNLNVRDYQVCLDAFTGIDRSSCERMDGFSGVIASAYDIAGGGLVPEPMAAYVDGLLNPDGTLRIVNVSANFTDTVQCGTPGICPSPDLTTEGMPFEGLTECEQRGSCLRADGSIEYDVTVAQCEPWTPSVATEPSGFFAVDIGRWVCALQGTGELECWAPAGATLPALADAPVTAADLVAIDCDNEHCVAVDAGRAAHLFGRDDATGCGAGDMFCGSTDPLVDPAVSVASAERRQSIAITSGGLLEVFSPACPDPFAAAGNLTIIGGDPEACLPHLMAQSIACKESVLFGRFPNDAVTPPLLCSVDDPDYTFFDLDYDQTGLCALRDGAPGAPSGFGHAFCARAPGAGYPWSRTDILQVAGSPGFNSVSTSKFYSDLGVAVGVVCGVTQVSRIECGVFNNTLGERAACSSTALLNPPTYASGYTEITRAGTCALCALRADGSGIDCWGKSIGTGGASYDGTHEPPPGSIWTAMGGASDAVGLTPYVVCGITDGAGLVRCNDPAYDPPLNTTAGSDDEFVPYGCISAGQTTVAGWEGPGCHPLLQGYASACGCSDDTDCPGDDDLCDPDTQRCVDAGGDAVGCSCTSTGYCETGRTCIEGACTLSCMNDAECPLGRVCEGGGCVLPGGVPYGEQMSWAMEQTAAPRNAITTWALSEVKATLILDVAVGIRGYLKLFGRERRIFDWSESRAWDLGSTWKGWYQPGLEARYDAECNPDAMTYPVTNRFPRSATSEFLSTLATGGVSPARNCANGGVCRYPENPWPALPAYSSPDQAPLGNAGDVGDLVEWCKDDVRDHVEDPDAPSPEQYADGILDTYFWGVDIGFSLYARHFPCAGGEPLTSWLGNLAPELDADGNIVDEGPLGDADCEYTAPTGGTWSFACEDVGIELLQAWGCLDGSYASAQTTLFYLTSLIDGPTLNTTRPDGSAQQNLDLMAMMNFPNSASFTLDFAPEYMRPEWMYPTIDLGFFSFRYTAPLGEALLAEIGACFDFNYNLLGNSGCPCTTDADCETAEGFTCLPPRLGRSFCGIASGTITPESYDRCPFVDLVLEDEPEQCCGDGVVQSSPTQIVAPAAVGSPQYVAHGCANVGSPGHPSNNDPMCIGLYYVEDCDPNEPGDTTCPSSCQLPDGSGSTGGSGPRGSCCVDAGTCFDNVGRFDCSGTWSDSSCAVRNWCEVEPFGVCCADDGTCRETTASGCRSPILVGADCSTPNICPDDGGDTGTGGGADAGGDTGTGGGADAGGDTGTGGGADAGGSFGDAGGFGDVGGLDGGTGTAPGGTGVVTGCVGDWCQSCVGTACTLVAACLPETADDADGDGLIDVEELRRGSDPSDHDTDQGGLIDGLEILAGRNPLDASDDRTFTDTDLDGLSDAAEQTLGTNPGAPDTDLDGLGDGIELTRRTDPLMPDTDLDGLRDISEDPNGTNPRDRDTDDDGALDGAELADGTDPLDADSDDDGVEDGLERVNGTNPLVADGAIDADGDGLVDAAEAVIGTRDFDVDTDDDTLGDGAEILAGTDPLAFDTDGDCLPDAFELANGLDPASADTDHDGLDDGDEVDLGTDPLLPDSDCDGVVDGVEVFVGTDPLDAGDGPGLADTDGDGLANVGELAQGTSATQSDTDLDGIGDGREVRLRTDPALADSDLDGLNDGAEVRIGTDPLDVDSDNDALGDGSELSPSLRTDPLVADTDGGGLIDGFEVLAGLRARLASDDVLLDGDGDGLVDAAEAAVGSDPDVADTDGGGVPDGRELRQGGNPTSATDDDYIGDACAGGTGAPVPLGACCRADGCLDLQTEALCARMGGSWNASQTCTELNYCEPTVETGACCVAGGGCVEDISATDCGGREGTWTAAATCSDACPVTPLFGACCIEGSCTDNVYVNECAGRGTFTADTACAEVACGEAPDPVGACCIAGACSENVPLGECAGAGGSHTPDAVCSDVVCPVPPGAGACCVDDGCVDVASSRACRAQGGLFGEGQTCATQVCPGDEVDAGDDAGDAGTDAADANDDRVYCCLSNGTCFWADTQADCEKAQGSVTAPTPGPTKGCNAVPGAPVPWAMLGSIGVALAVRRRRQTSAAALP